MIKKEAINMDDRLLNDSLEALYRLREELHGKADDSVIEQLEEIINDLEKARHEGSNKINATDVLKKLGSAIELISAIANIISKLM
jgi:hypothetical protein